MRKNCEPFVFGPALAIERIPAPESNRNDRVNSSFDLLEHTHLNGTKMRRVTHRAVCVCLFPMELHESSLQSSTCSGEGMKKETASYLVDGKLIA